MATSDPISITFRIQTYNSNGTVNAGYTSTYNGLKATRDFPKTTQRVRPSDLFLSGTARTTIGKMWSHQTFSWRTCSYSGCSLYTNYPVFQMWYYDDLSNRYSDYTCTKVLSNPPASIDRNAMYNSIRSNLKNEATNLANMLGEYKETAQTFLDLAQVVATRGKSLMKRHKSGLNAGKVSFRKTAAQNRLAWEYGIRPLANDIGTALAELRSGIAATPLFKEGTVRRKTSATNIGYRLPSSTVYSGRGVSEVKLEVVCRTRWRAYMNQNVLLQCLAAHGVLNPPALMWELTPFSFVVDWWFNVGDVLSSMDNLIICDKLMVIDSTSTKYFEYVTPYGDSNTLSKATSFYHRRTDVRSAPTEISRVSTLQYKPSLSLGHILNGLALLYVAKGRLS